MSSQQELDRKLANRCGVHVATQLMQSQGKGSPWKPAPCLASRLSCCQPRDAYEKLPSRLHSVQKTIVNSPRRRNHWHRTVESCSKSRGLRRKPPSSGGLCFSRGRSSRTGGGVWEGFPEPRRKTAANSSPILPRLDWHSSAFSAPVTTILRASIATRFEGVSNFCFQRRSPMVISTFPPTRFPTVAHGFTATAWPRWHCVRPSV